MKSFSSALASTPLQRLLRSLSSCPAIYSARASDNRHLDGDTITVNMMQWKRRGGGEAIIAPAGGGAWAPAKPQPVEAPIRALARAHRWKRMLEEGTGRSAAEIAEAECITRSFVNRLLRLTLLAPDLQEAILRRQAAEGLQLEELTGTIPSGWREQREASGAA